MKIIEKNKKNKKFILLIMLLLSFFTFQTVVYSSVSSTFNITGSAAARVATDVRVTSFRIASATNSGVSNYEEFGKNHVSTGLQLPSRNATVTYYVEVTNYGNTDVGIYSISGLPSNLTYTISDYTLKNKICDDTGKCNGVAKKTFSITLQTSAYTWTGYTGDVNLTFDFRPFYKVTYEGITNNNYPTEVLSGDSLRISFKEDLNRVLISANGTQLGYYATVTNGQTISVNNITSDVVVKLKPYVAQLVRGTLDAYGSEICISDECFYLLYSDSNSVWLFPKYNLHVGWSVGSYSNESGASNVTQLTNPTGKQNSSALGATYDARDQMGLPWIGAIGFSPSNYWIDKNTGNFLSDFATDFSLDEYNFASIYNSSSNLYTPFENYKTYLENLGVIVNSIRPIRGSELNQMGCNLEISSCLYAPDWVRSTSYWVGTAIDDYVMMVTPTYYSFWPYGYVDAVGARPMIELPRSEVSPTPNIGCNFSIVSGDINTVGSEICFSDQCFYVMYNDSINVTLMSKYNLDVGYRVTGWNSSTNSFTKYKINNATGKQNSSARGTAGSQENPQFPFVGTIAYSSDKYWTTSSGSFKTDGPHNYLEEGEGYRYIYNNGSNIYQYIENYRKYLESIGVVVNHARLVSAGELNWMACQYSANCDDIPSFTYSTSYWTGTGNETIVVGMFSNYGLYGESYMISSNDLLGVRPVITVPVVRFN